MAKSSDNPGAAANGRLSQDKIQRLAYELWAEDGQPQGRDQHYWYRAEHELTSSASPLKKMGAPAVEPPKAKAAARRTAAPSVT